MSFHTTIARLREASYAAPAAGENPDTCRVGRQDLRATLHLIDRLDADLQRAAQASAPVAGEAVAWRVTHPRCPKPRWLDAAREPAPSLDEVKQQDACLALELAYAAPQASEAVRNAALEEAAALVGGQLWGNASESVSALIARHIRTMKTQAEKDGAQSPANRRERRASVESKGGALSSPSQPGKDGGGCA